MHAKVHAALPTESAVYIGQQGSTNMEFKIAHTYSVRNLITRGCDFS